jgi:hypothetical protein
MPTGLSHIELEPEFLPLKGQPHLMHKEVKYHDDVELMWEDTTKWIRKECFYNPAESTEFKLFALTK